MLCLNLLLLLLSPGRMNRNIPHRLLGCLLLLLGTSTPSDAYVDRVVAIVNDEVITLSELELTRQQLKNPLLQQLVMDFDEPSTDQVLQSPLKHLIKKRLQLQAAQKRGIAVGKETVFQALQEVKLQQGLSSDTAILKTLSINDLTLAHLSRELKNYLMILKMVQREIHPHIVIRELDVRHYYDRNQEQFVRPERMHLAQIFLPFPPDSSEEMILAIEEKAEKVLEHLSGGDSPEIASQVMPTNLEGAEWKDLGLINPGELVREIQEALSLLEPGQNSPVIRTPSGLRIFRLIGKTPPDFLSYKDAKTQIHQRLFLERSKAAYLEWIQKLRNESYVEIRM